MHSNQFLLGAAAHNQHVQNLAQALYEAGVLGEYHTGGADLWKAKWMRKFREFAGEQYPTLDAKLSRRRIRTVPERTVTTDWRWEGPRLAAKKIGLGRTFEDWLWERGEYAIDHYCAEKIAQIQYQVFMGVEFGALAALTRAKELGKRSIVAFLSPHHATRERWVDIQYRRFPDLQTRVGARLLAKSQLRDARRDDEARLADVIHCTSRFTKDSLVAAGIPKRKIIVASLGCPPPSDISEEDVPRPKLVRFLYSGSVSVHKGAHLLLQAWKMLRPGATAELHFCGGVTLPERYLKNLGAGVFFHGNVSLARINREYRSASVLVFPTLCDGFGMVVAEAFANGLPVLTTPNAGAADLIHENKNGWLVAPGDADALAARLEWCIDHAEALEDFREPARETARQWTWAHFRNCFITQVNEKLAPTLESANA